MQQELLPGLEFTLNDQLLMLFAVILLVIGLALAFAGRAVWKRVMSFIGAIVGGLLGFAFGQAVSNNILIAFVVGALGAIVGSAVFIFLARVGISALAGVLAFLVLAGFVNVVIALVAGFVVFVITFVYAEVAIGIVTAIAGGLLTGFALMMLGVDSTLAIVAMLVIIVLGATLQMSLLKEQADGKRMRAAARASPVAAAAMTAPAAPPMPGRTCPKCGGPAEYIPEYNRYYCFRCQHYE